jgi:hypothetical protein
MSFAAERGFEMTLLESSQQSVGSRKRSVTVFFMLPAPWSG